MRWPQVKLQIISRQLRKKGLSGFLKDLKFEFKRITWAPKKRCKKKLPKLYWCFALFI